MGGSAPSSRLALGHGAGGGALRTLLPAALALVVLLAAGLLRARLPAPVAPPPARVAVSADAWRLLSLDHPTVAATLAWIDVVRRYGADPEDGGWLPEALAPVGALDPRWKTPWVYGALMARSLDDTEAHGEVLHDAMAVFPAEPWFPYTLGMSLYLDHGDREGAARWLEHAGSLPGAPAVHRAAAKALRELE